MTISTRPAQRGRHRSALSVSLAGAAGLLALVCGPVVAPVAHAAPGPLVTYPATSIVLQGSKPVYSPNRLRVRMSYGCNFTITNTLTYGEWVLYGTPGSWKRLEYIAAGAAGGAGIGIPMTAYFSLYDNQKAVLTVRCTY